MLHGASALQSPFDRSLILPPRPCRRGRICQGAFDFGPSASTDAPRGRYKHRASCRPMDGQPARSECQGRTSRSGRRRCGRPLRAGPHGGRGCSAPSSRWHSSSTRMQSSQRIRTSKRPGGVGDVDPEAVEVGVRVQDHLSVTRSRSQWLQEPTAPRRSVSALAPAAGSHEALWEAPDLPDPCEIHYVRPRPHPARFVASSREGSHFSLVANRRRGSVNRSPQGAIRGGFAVSPQNSVRFARCACLSGALARARRERRASSMSAAWDSSPALCPVPWGERSREAFNSVPGDQQSAPVG